jgi:hypothetical protein
MTSSFAFILALLFAFANAGKFSLPIYQEQNERTTNLINKRHEKDGGSQRPLQNGPEPEHPLINTNEDGNHKPSSSLRVRNFQ